MKNKPHDSTAAERVLQKAARLDTVTRALCIAATVATVVTGVLPLFSAFTISGNLDAGIVDEAATAAIAPVLPLGYACIPLILIGVLLSTVLFFKKKPLLALFGIGVCAVGSAFLVLFALACAEAFPFREFAVGGGIREVGLQFSDLFWRYYIALTPLALMLGTLIPALRANHHRGIAEMMTGVDAPATIALDETDETA